MPRPRFSIVVPTRNRPETLQATLRTCLAQTFEDYDVIVSDNCSEPRTREVVEALQSPNIRYLRPEAPLAMSKNWEFALSHATGEFITVLGDDDGLLFHALREADDMIRSLNVEVLNSRAAFYAWPGATNVAFSDSTLSIPTLAPSRVRKSRRLLYDIVGPLSNMGQLPSLYNSFVHRDVLESIRGGNGCIFNSCIPDWYTGFAFAATIDRYGESGVPLRIDGVSSKSNGHGVSRGVPNPIQTDFVQLNATSGIPWNANVPTIPMSVAAIAAECLEQLRENLRLDDSRLVINPRDLVCAIMRDLRSNRYPIPAETWSNYVDELERYAARTGETDWCRLTFPDLTKDAPPAWKAPKRWATGLYPDRLVLDVSQFNVTDVYGAAQLFEMIFRRKDVVPESLTDTSPISRWIYATKDLVRELSGPALVHAGRQIRKRIAAAKQGLGS